MDEPIESELIQTPKTSKSGKNPFPGLRPFNIDENHLFFGREGQSDNVLLKLSKNRFVGVIGPSGSGKSSFIYCGVLPILYGGFLANKSSDWNVIVTRPGNSPIDNLTTAILNTDQSYQSADENEKRVKNTITTSLLRSSSMGLVETLLQSKEDSNKNFLILVDQFEELFRFKENAGADSVNQALEFINLLVEAINYSEASIYVAITMRSDFIGDCAQFPDLTKKINDSHYLIPQMTREQKRRVITGPMAVGGAEVSSRLIQRLLNDLGNNTDQLPILQHSLMRTWNYWEEFGNINETIDLKHYEAIGTMAEALSLHANEAYDELKERQKQICETIFKAITEKRGENFGIRRPTKLGEIAAIADVAEEEVIEVIEKFRLFGRSLITPSAGVPLVSGSIIDISHESLMRIWVRLKNWVNEEEVAVQMYLRLAEAASMYQVGKAGLWRPPDLQLALNWQIKHKPTLVWGQRHHPAFERTMVFLEYSKKEFDTEQKIKELQRKRQLQRARTTALVLATATVISLLFLLYAFQQKSEADKNALQAQKAEAEAKKEKIQAEQARTKAEEAQIRAEEAQTRAEKSEKAALVAEQKAEQSAIEAKIAQENAEKQKRQADLATIRAQEQKVRANVAKDSAEVAKNQALIAKENADRLRFQAIAKSMAIKSSQLKDSENQKELEGLLAQQAYTFNTEYKGEIYDNDIYNALYNAIKLYNDPLSMSLKGHEKAIRVVEASTTNNYIYSGGVNGKVIRWKLNGENRVADTVIQVRDNHLIRTLAINSNNTKIIVGGDYPYLDEYKNTYIEVFDLNNRNKPPVKVEGFRYSVTKILMTKDQQGAYVLNDLGKSVKHTNFNETNEVITFQASVQDMILSHDGNWIYTADSEGSVDKYEINNQFEKTNVFNNSFKILSIAISSDGYIAIGEENGNLQLINTNDIRDIKYLVGHTSWINNIRFSTNNKFIATSSNDNTVRLWNRTNLNAQPITLADHNDWVWSVAFTADNTQVMAATTNKEIKVWPTLRDDMSDKLCQYLTRNFEKGEWDTYVAPDIPYRSTCENLPANK